MRDVCEWTTMHERWVVFQCLHQVRLHCGFQQYGHCAVCCDIAAEYGAAVAAIGHDHIAQTLLQVFQVFGQTQNRHNLGCNGDVKPCLAWETIGDTTQGRCDGAQGAVVHINNAAPNNAACVDFQFITPINVVVDHCGQQ